MQLSVRGLHLRAADEAVDRVVSARNRMAPPRELARREAQRRQRERRMVHPQLRIHEHVELIVSNRRSDDRGARSTAAKFDEAIGARSNLLGNLVHARTEMIDEHLKTLAIEFGQPTSKIATRSAHMKKSRCKADAQT